MPRAANYPLNPSQTRPPPAPTAPTVRKITSIDQSVIIDPPSGIGDVDLSTTGDVTIIPILNRTLNITVPNFCCVVSVDYYAGSVILEGDAALAII